MGFIGLECQIRADSALVIDALKTAGHAVAMVTGDAPLTALHVANNSCFEALYANVLLSGAGTTCFKSSGTHDEGTDGISSARDRQAMYLLKR